MPYIPDFYDDEDETPVPWDVQRLNQEAEARRQAPRGLRQGFDAYGGYPA